MADNKSHWIWPAVENMRTAQKVTHLYGFWAAILVSAMTTLAAFFTQNYGSLFDAAIFAVIAWGLYELSRVAAVAGLFFYLVNKIILLQMGALFGPVSIFMMLMFVHGVRGTFGYHYFRQQSIAKKKVALKQ